MFLKNLKIYHTITGVKLKPPLPTLGGSDLRLNVFVLERSVVARFRKQYYCSTFPLLKLVVIHKLSLVGELGSSDKLENQEL